MLIRLLRLAPRLHGLLHVVRVGDLRCALHLRRIHQWLDCLLLSAIGSIARFARGKTSLGLCILPPNFDGQRCHRRGSR